MKLDLHPRQSGSRRRDRRNREDVRRRGAALRALRAAARPQGDAVRVPGPRRVHREVFRGGARCARARLRGRDPRLARAGPVGARAAERPQGPRLRLLRIRPRPRSLREGDRAARLPAAALRARPFDGRGGADPLGAARAALVRPHRADRADDQSLRAPPARPSRGHGAHPAAARLGQLLRSGRRRHARSTRCPSPATA